MSQTRVMSVVSEALANDTRALILWQVGGAMMGDESVRIVKMFYLDGEVEVFAKPIEGSALLKNGYGVHVTIPQNAIRFVNEVVALADWQTMIEEIEADILAAESEDDEPDEPEAQQSTAPGGFVPNLPPNLAPAAQATPNGQAPVS